MDDYCTFRRFDGKGLFVDFRTTSDAARQPRVPQLPCRLRSSGRCRHALACAIRPARRPVLLGDLPELWPAIRGRSDWASRSSFWSLATRLVQATSVSVECLAASFPECDFSERALLFGYGQPSTVAAMEAPTRPLGSASARPPIRTGVSFSQALQADASRLLRSSRSIPAAAGTAAVHRDQASVRSAPSAMQ